MIVMRGFLTIGLLLVVIMVAPLQTAAQPPNLLELKQKLRLLKDRSGDKVDTAYVNTMNQVAFLYADRYPDSALTILKDLPDQSVSIGYHEGETDSYKILGNALQTKGDFDKALEYYEHAYQIAAKKKFQSRLPALLGNIALVYLNKGNYPASLQKFYAALKAAELTGDKLVIRSSLNNIGTIHFYQGKMDEAEVAYQKTLELSRGLSDTTGIILAYNNLGEVALEQDNPVKALHHLAMAYNLARFKNIPDMLVAVTNTLGDTYLLLDSTQQAIRYFDTALQLAKQQGNARATCKGLIGLAKVQLETGRLEEALSNGREGLKKAGEMGQAQLLRDAYEVVAAVYEKMGDGNNAIKYYRNYKKYADSLVSIESERAAANYKAGYEFSKKELEFQRKSVQQRWLIFSVSAALVSLLIILSLIIRNRKRLSKTYRDLQHKNEVIEKQKRAAEETLDQLKHTQSQLIQAEKMASLGELTAGIAHEIQNPLNFVNNFSEVNSELIADMHVEIDKGDFVEAKSIANDIRQNMEKINHHGKRADSIVKGMLQHSRSSSGQKEPTNINALANEYLRLAYHGLRAKDKSFNATLKTDFDETLDKINIIPQDIGRVILNLITNAFYAVDEKEKNNPQDYEPTVTVSTKLLKPTLGGLGALISVSDNGNGIPQNVLDKIFQPFFTTKPTGQGTGLGLSLAYDIVKAHGGELSVETKENQGSQFHIRLPLK
jgi:signal transduction histidine kinase/Tfp pilus assembly protein PilF